VGLQEQQKLSLGTSEAWWLDVLHRGYLWKSKHGQEDYFGEWHDEATTEVLFSSYTEFAKAQNERHPMSRETFGAFLGTMGAKWVRLTNGVTGERVADIKVNDYGDTRPSLRRNRTIRRCRLQPCKRRAFGDRHLRRKNL
jgi:hypothetical protein